MRKFYSLLALGLLASASSMAQGGQSASPDAYGYTWKSDTVAGGPTYSWIDISGTGTQINGLADDNTIGPINLGFTFRYYWTDVNQIRIGSNGYILLGTNGQISSGTTGFPAMPTPSAPNNVVAPMLTDLNFSQEAGATQNPGKVYFQSNNTDQAIVSFVDVPFWTAPATDPNGWSGANTFQVIFSKADSSITFQYQSQSGNWNSGYDLPAVTHPLVIGIENITGGIGMQVSNTQKPTAGRAIRFYYPDNVVYSVTDAGMRSINNDDNRGFFGIRGAAMPITATVANVGNQDITGNVNVKTTVRKISNTGSPVPGAPLFDKTQAVSNINQGDEATITYTDLFTAGPPPANNYNPSYLVQSTLTLTGDQNSTNNTTTNELVILDTAGVNTVHLTYADTIAEGGLGFEGGGVYFKPPFYPVTIQSLKYFITAAAGTVPSNGYVAKVWGEDPVTGLPSATPLFEQTMLANDILLNSYNNIVPVNPPVQITSGGFYVSWQATGATQNAYLGTDGNGPFSRQSYEVLFNVFGEYRSGDTEDLMIAAEVTFPAAVGRAEDLNKNLSIGAIYPNPANHNTVVPFSLVNATDINVKVINITGQEVKQINFGTVTPATTRLTVPVSDLTSGIYFMTITAGNETVTRKLVINK